MLQVIAPQNDKNRERWAAMLNAADEVISEDDGAWLNCQCKSVRISIPKRSILRYECCCCDCRKALSFFPSKGNGPQPPTLPDIAYFPNLLMVTEGRRHLRCFTLAPGFPSRRVYASCCWTCLLADNPAYEAKRFAVMANAWEGMVVCCGTARDGQSPLAPADARIRQGDMTDAELAALPAFNAPPRQRTWIEGTAQAEATLAEMRDASGSWKAKWQLWHLETLQELIDSLPTGVEVMDPYHDGPTPYWLKHGFAPHHRATASS